MTVTDKTTANGVTGARNARTSVRFLPDLKMTVTDKTTANGVTGARNARTSVRPTARLHVGTEIGPWQKTEMLTGTSAWARMLRSST